MNTHRARPANHACEYRFDIGTLFARVWVGMLAETYRRRLREVALDQHGLVTTDNARALGIPPAQLRSLAHRGGLTRVAHGVYRFDDIPPSAYDGYMEAVLAAGPDALLVADAVLAMLDLGLANPTRLRVATPRRVSRALPAFVELVRRPVDEEKRTSYEGVPAQHLVDAIRESRGLVMAERLLDAVTDAHRRGLIRRDDADQLERELRADAKG